MQISALKIQIPIFNGYKPKRDAIIRVTGIEKNPVKPEPGDVTVLLACLEFQ